MHDSPGDRTPRQPAHRCDPVISCRPECPKRIFFTMPGQREPDDSAGSEDTMCDNKQPDAAVPDTADTDTEPLTSEIGNPVSEGDTDTEPLTPETGQPRGERDTDTTTRLSDTHVLESPCGSDGPTRRLRSKSVNTAKEKRQLTLLERVSTSVSSGTSNTHKQPTLK